MPMKKLIPLLLIPLFFACGDKKDSAYEVTESLSGTYRLFSNHPNKALIKDLIEQFKSYHEIKVTIPQEEAVVAAVIEDQSSLAISRIRLLSKEKLYIRRLNVSLKVVLLAKSNDDSSPDLWLVVRKEVYDNPFGKEFIRFFCSSDAESIFEKHNYTKENNKQLCEFSLKF